MSDAGILDGPREVLDALASKGIRTVADVVAKAETVRVLPERRNLRITAGAVRLFVKVSKGTRSREVEALERAAKAGVPVPAVLLRGVDPALGTLVATADLAPARPLDDVLRARILSEFATSEALRSLARATAALHDARLFHHDLYLNHVFVDPGSATPSVTLIDLERASRLWTPLGHGAVKDLAAIESSIPEALAPCARRARWLATYLRARGLPSSRLRPLARRVVGKAARIRAHVPRTPVGDAGRPP